jgi:ABC-type lipoprotein release transport system permease subunit
VLTDIRFAFRMLVKTGLATGRLLAAQLYQISPHNPVLLALTAMGLAVAACLIPARQATSIDPIQALRTE